MGTCHMAQGTQTGAPYQSRGVGWGERRREAQEGGDICVTIVDSCWCLTKQQNSVKQLSLN